MNNLFVCVCVCVCVCAYFILTSFGATGPHMTARNHAITQML
jgi:hypothetical protein